MRSFFLQVLDSDTLSAMPFEQDESIRARARAERYLATCTEYTDPYERDKLIRDWAKKGKAARESVDDFKLRAGTVIGSRIIDIGFGGGEYVYAFAKAGADVYGLEVNPTLKEIAEEYLKSEDVHATLSLYEGNKFPFENNFFDHAFSVSVLEHVSDAPLMLREVDRTLKHGGKFYLAFPNRWRVREAHTGIFFLSYLPRRLAEMIMRRLWKRNAVEELNLHFLSYWSLKRLLRGTSLRVVFEYGGRKWSRRVLKRMLGCLGIHHSAILGTVMVILKKE